MASSGALAGWYIVVQQLRQRGEAIHQHSALSGVQLCSITGHTHILSDKRVLWSGPAVRVEARLR